MTIENAVLILDEATATKAKPKAKAATKAKPATATKAKAPAKPKAKKETPVATPEPETKKPELSVVEGTGKGPGRPISEKQVKVRRRVQAFLEKQTGHFTVKEVSKALRESRMHVSNALRWADHQKMVKKDGYKDNQGRAGRKELLFVSLVTKTEGKKAA